MSNHGYRSLFYYPKKWGIRFIITPFLSRTRVDRYIVVYLQKLAVAAFVDFVLGYVSRSLEIQFLNAKMILNPLMPFLAQR